MIKRLKLTLLDVNDKIFVWSNLMEKIITNFLINFMEM